MVKTKKNILNKILLFKRTLQTRVKTFIARHTCASWGYHSVLVGSARLDDPWNISVGDETIINEGVYMNAYDKITIGNKVHVSSFCIINTGFLKDENGQLEDHEGGGVIIEDGVWLASGVIINPGVTIGARSIIGSGAVVTKSIPPDSVAVGVPAKVIRQRSK